MNTTQLKSYAPEARRAFIAAVTAQAARLGISAKEIAPAEVQGDVLLVNGQAFPKSAQGGRQKLIGRVKAHGFEATMDAVAYTWFNRLVAIRYMELHDYLDHGYRVLSNPDGSGRPEILDKAADVELAGLDRAKVVELKLDGTKDEELYRLLLKAQCNALHKAMPFLFEQIGDETELLLPPNLLHTDSLVRQLVESIDEDLWTEIEIIGWLYQFYISEKKDEVIGKVVKSEDIPAATQLFTPNWIVKYMVQNSLGAQWLATYPNSSLREQMEYYIEPAEQTEEVKAQLAAITPESLNPEEITLIDPACGSGHILVEAYDLFKAIYVEHGYREREAAALILTKNLYGLDIDQRAAQLAGFALMMKGRADDRRLFARGLKLNVVAMIDSAGLDVDEITRGSKLESFGLTYSDLRELKALFECTTTFGSLIQVPENLAEKLAAMGRLSESHSQDMFTMESLGCLSLLVRQAGFLAYRYDCVVANPPFMGSKFHCASLKKYLKESFKNYNKDLFSAFVKRNLLMTKQDGKSAFVTPFGWMFLGSYETLRSDLFSRYSISTLVKPSYTSFFESAIVPLVTFVVEKGSDELSGTFFDLGYLGSAEAQPQKLKEGLDGKDCDYKYVLTSADIRRIPGSPVAFSVNPKIRDLFEKFEAFEVVGAPKVGMQTANNDRFLRLWYEVDWSLTSMYDPVAKTWVAYCKGGAFRKWWGNNWYVLGYFGTGQLLKAQKNATLPDESIYEKVRCTWTDISSSSPFGARLAPSCSFYDIKGHSFFPKELHDGTLALSNCKVFGELVSLLNPGLNFQVGDVKRVPVPTLGDVPDLADLERACVEISQADWNAFEISWRFQGSPLLVTANEGSLASSFSERVRLSNEATSELKSFEEQINTLLINAYGVNDVLTSEVPVEQVTLTVNPAYRYGTKRSEEERQNRFREDTMAELVSYAVGCMMGRYSLDEPGLIYAHSGNEGFDPSRYTKFRADDDGIIPLTDSAWFEDDAANRLIEFISVAWDADHLEENLTFLADNLSPKKNETSRDTIRRYLCDKFFKDHLQTYKKRPIYWLFSSGKQKAFQCLVYLHRYNEGTLARMRSEFVIPLQGKLVARLEHLKADIQATDSSAQQKRLEKEADNLKKQQIELVAFDEKLRHYADRRIKLDLDDGVKENYGKFGSLLAEVITVHGKKPKGP